MNRSHSHSRRDRGTGREAQWRTVLACAALLAGLAALQPVSAATLANHTPALAGQAQDLGPEAAGRTLQLTLWLSAPGGVTDEQVQQLYDPTSPSYHRWLTADQAAPSAAQVAVVKAFLAQHNLAVASVGRGNRFVRAQGSVANVQKAMNVQIHRFRSANGREFHANTGNPTINGAAGALVHAVSGLTQHQMRPHSARAVDPETGAPRPAVRLSASPAGVFYSAQCFLGQTTQTFTTNGGLPTATYSGNRYGQDINNGALGTWAPCGYQPSEMQTAYNLNALYDAGLDGTGQTVVIVDAYGSPTIADDADVFSQIYGLPGISSANLQVYYPSGAPAAPDPGWATETTLDVEWAHAIAPGANIALVVAPSANDSDLEVAIQYAIDNHLGNVISMSWGEAEEAGLDFATYATLARSAAAQGISLHWSSGDGGDTNPSGFTGLPVFGVNFPSSLPWATAIGGVTVGLKSDNSKAFETGWGNNITRVVNTIGQGSTPVDPPLLLGFQGGSGGGASTFYSKPRFQRSLHGQHRLVPDISWLADPYTGAEIICDVASCDGGAPGLAVYVYGGTSLACPMFSGLWAVAAQKAGEPLGQAAQMLYQLGSGAITDVLPPQSEHNAHGRITDAAGVTHYSASDLAQPLDGTHQFLGALYNSPFSTRWYVLTFGTDSSLLLGQGWDNVTGLGSPNGKHFVDAVAHAAHNN